MFSMESFTGSDNDNDVSSNQYLCLSLSSWRSLCVCQHISTRSYILKRISTRFSCVPLHLLNNDFLIYLFSIKKKPKLRPASCYSYSKSWKAKQENISKLVNCEDWLNTQEIKSWNAYTSLADTKAACMKSQLCAAACAVQTHWSCLRLVTGRKGLAVSLAGPLSRAKLVTCWRYEYKGCEEWERHADNKIQRGEIKWRNVALLTEPFPLGIKTDCDLFHGQQRHGSTPFNPLTE